MEKKPVKTVVLNITTFIGSSFGATHYYGTLYLIRKDIPSDIIHDYTLRYVINSEDDEIEVVYEMTEQEAIDLDKSDNDGYVDSIFRHHRHWKAGIRESKRFDSFNKVLSFGRKMFESLKLSDVEYIVLYENEKIKRKNK